MGVYALTRYVVTRAPLCGRVSQSGQYSVSSMRCQIDDILRDGELTFILFSVALKCFDADATIMGRADIQGHPMLEGRVGIKKLATPGASGSQAGP